MIINFLKRNYLFIILAILAITIHMAFLSYPSQTIFDEVYFGRYASLYFSHQYYFDIHPPLGKLIIAGWSKLMGYNPVFDFDKIGEKANPQLFFTLRFLPAFFGALFVLLFSYFSYLVSRSKKVALIAGFLILFDNAFLVQSRIIAIDIFLLFFEILSLCFFFLYQRQKSFSRKWLIFLSLTAISFGLAISIKWTGLATFGIMAGILLVKPLSQKLNKYLNPSSKNHDVKKLFKEAIAGITVLLSLGFLIYLIPFKIHFNLLTKSGTGDAFMSVAFQEELKYGSQNTPRPLNFWQKFTELNAKMYSASAGLAATHPFSSKWYNWPLDNKPIYYWYQGKTGEIPGKVAKIYFLGNPIIWWLVLGSVFITIAKLLFKKERNDVKPIFYILLFAYLANLLPFIPIKRVSFLYHYMPSVMFGILLLSFYLVEIWRGKKEIFIALFMLIAAVFIIILPLSYGWPMSPELDKLEMEIVNLLS